REDLAQDHLLAEGVGKLDADDGAAGDGGDAGGERGHRPRDVVGEADDAGGLEAGRGLQLVHGDDGAGADGGDLPLHAVVVEDGFEHPRVLLQRLVRERAALDGGGAGEEREGGDFVGGRGVVEAEARLGLGEGLLRGRGGLAGGKLDAGGAGGGAGHGWALVVVLVEVGEGVEAEFLLGGVEGGGVGGEDVAGGNERSGGRAGGLEGGGQWRFGAAAGGQGRLGPRRGRGAGARLHGIGDAGADAILGRGLGSRGPARE